MDAEGAHGVPSSAGRAAAIAAGPPTPGGPSIDGPGPPTDAVDAVAAAVRRSAVGAAATPAPAAVLRLHHRPSDRSAIEEVEAEGDMMGDDDGSGGDYGGREEDEREGGIEVEQQGGEVEEEAEQSVNDVDDEWASQTMRRRRAFAVLKEEEKANRASPEPGSGRDGAGDFRWFYGGNGSIIQDREALMAQTSAASNVESEAAVQWTTRARNAPGRQLDSHRDTARTDRERAR
ncbi:hypothetical protein ACHAXT_003925 [Thalassiosira profunda]